MTMIDNYNFGTTAETLDVMTDEEAKEYFEGAEADSYLASAEFHDSKYL